MDDTLASYQKQFNYSAEELDSVLRVLGENGQEAVGSMGDDTPFAVLSSQPRIIYDLSLIHISVRPAAKCCCSWVKPASYRITADGYLRIRRA